VANYRGTYGQFIILTQVYSVESESKLVLQLHWVSRPSQSNADFVGAKFNALIPERNGIVAFGIFISQCIVAHPSLLSIYHVSKVSVAMVTLSSVGAIIPMHIVAITELRSSSSSSSNRMHADANRERTELTALRLTARLCGIMSIQIKRRRESKNIWSTGTSND